MGNKAHLRTVTIPAFPHHAGIYGTKIDGEFSRLDGYHNTHLILTAEPENKIATYLRELQIDGHQDFYWPAQYENNLLCINLPDHIPLEWHWSSTQYSAHFAWYPYFGDGYQDFSHKGLSLAVRAVRRELII